MKHVNTAAPEKFDENAKPALLEKKRALEYQIWHDPKNPEHYAELIWIESRLQQEEHIIELFEKLNTLGGFSKISEDRLSRAAIPAFHVLLKRRPLTEVEGLVEQVSALPPCKELDRWHLKAGLYFARENWPKVLKYAGLYWQQFQSMDRPAREKLAPNHAGATYLDRLLYWGTLAAIRLHKWAQAMDFFEALLSRQDFTGKDAAEFLHQIQHVEYARAVEFLKKLWERFSNAAFVLETLEVFPLERLKPMEKIYLQKHILPRLMSEPTLELGRLLVLFEKFSNAAQVFETLMKHPALAEEAAFLCTQALFEDGQFEKAMDILQKAAMAYPSNRRIQLLHEALQPAMGTVVKLPMIENPELENELCLAVRMCQRMLAQAQYEVFVLLCKNIHQVLRPEQPRPLNDFKEITRDVQDILEEAEANGMPKLVQSAKQLLQEVKQKIATMQN